MHRYRLINTAPLASALILFVLIISFVSPGRIGRAASQTSEQPWSTPENLSQSGAASMPRIFTSPDGTQQVFWVDRFDGLLTTIFTAGTWSPPTPASIPGYLGTMPLMISDRSGWIHAFWQVPTGKVNPVDTLFHSQLPIGSSTWTLAEQVAEDAMLYAISAPVDGGLSLAYIRRANSGTASSGVYVRQLGPSGGGWNTSQNIYASIYYRLLQPGSTNVSIADDGQGNIFVSWFDPDQSQTLIVHSADNGVTWGTPQSHASPNNLAGGQASVPRIAAMPGTVFSVWQSTASTGCSLYQQNWLGLQGTPAEWSTPAQIFPSLNACPSGDSFWAEPASNLMYWLTGEGSSSLGLSAWNPEGEHWSVPLTKSFSFEDSRGTGLIILDDLHAAILDNEIAVVGNDPNGEVWITHLLEPLSDFTYAPPPEWNSAQPVTESGMAAFDFDLVMDRQGFAHLAYAEIDESTNARGALGAALVYTRWDQENNSPDQLLNSKVKIVNSNPNIMVRQPSILTDETNQLLHLVWSGSNQGEILYTRAPLDEGTIPGEWFPPQTISSSEFATYPKVGADATGRIYVIYMTPYNEGRGIHLTTSEDRGQTWSIPELVIDAAAANLQAIDHLTFHVTPEGVLHAAWVETAPSGNNLPQGIFYSYSSDNGRSWSEPMVLAGPDNDWPRLIVAGGKLHLLYAQNSAQGGLINHRSRPLEIAPDEADLGESAWGTSIRIPGWAETSLPFGTATSGRGNESTLHLVGVNPQNGSFSYSEWGGDSWGVMEAYSPPDTIATGRGLLAAARPEGGNLATAWLSTLGQPDSPEQSEFTNLYFTTRNINVIDIIEVPTPIPTADPTPTPAPTPTVIIPTPTPDLNRVPAPDYSTQMPLILGGVLAAILVAILFIWRLIRSRRS